MCEVLRRRALFLLFGLGSMVVGPLSAFAADTPENLYSAITTAINKTFEQDPSRRLSGQGVRYEDGAKYYHVDFCLNESYLGVDHSPDIIGLAIRIAYHVRIYRNDFEGFKVPDTVWKGTIARMDQIAIEALRDSFVYAGKIRDSKLNQREDEYVQLQKRLVSDLQTYRASNATLLPEVEYDQDCLGNGVSDVEIRTTPRGAQVSYIAVFDFELCKARSIDPEDLRRCHGWQQALKDKEVLLGAYRYVAIWPDGTKRTGAFTINRDTVISISR